MIFKKICVITEHVPSQWAHSINTMKMAQGFYDLGYYVEIIVILRYFEDLNLKKVRNVHGFYGINHKIRIKYFRDLSPLYLKDLRIVGPFSIFLMNFFRITSPKLYTLFDIEKRISDYCLKNKFDFSYCRRTEKAAYYNIINNIPTIIEDHKNYNKKISYELKSLINLSNNFFFKGIITIHNLLKNQFIRFGLNKEKILVIDDAVDISSFDDVIDDTLSLRKQLGLNLDHKIILYGGSLKRGKAISNILNVAFNIQSYSKNIFFYLIGGSKKEINYWKKKVKFLRINNIKFLGFKSNKLIPKYLKSCDILIMLYDLSEKNPVLDVKTTSPLKLFEYMASKKPIISTKIEPIEKILTNNFDAILTEERNINQVVESIKMLLININLSKYLAQNAYSKVQQFTYKRRCNHILSFSFFKNRNDL